MTIGKLITIQYEHLYVCRDSAVFAILGTKIWYDFTLVGVANYLTAEILPGFSCILSDVNTLLLNIKNGTSLG